VARTLFHDDFADGIWTKHPGNPVIVRDQLWAESHYICEPNIIHADGLFRMWFSQMFPANGKSALGYATSPDGFTWTKHPGNPVLASDEYEVHRPSVMRHAGMYYLYAVQHENDPETASMRRWKSRDGLGWEDEGCVMRPTQGWERGLSNMAVVVDDDGTWRMIYTGADAPPAPQFGYAWSPDGLTWTKHEGNPVISGFYGGDPFMTRIGDWYYVWHSEAMGGSLRIACRRSRDLIHWERVSGHTDINYTEPWERGVAPEDGGTASGWYGHLTDATLCEADGRVFLIYQGAQTPLGIATFDGTLTELARRLEHPPLSRWEPSPFGMVDGGVLKLADNESERSPLVARVDGAGEDYVLRARLRCYGGPTHRVSILMRYAAPGALARVWLHDAGTIYYQECLNGLLSNPRPLGSAPIADDAWHDWEVAVAGRRVHVTVDAHGVGETLTSEALLRRLLGEPVHIGFSTHDTWVSIAGVSVVG
jgi:hypothetical protein